MRFNRTLQGKTEGSNLLERRKHGDWQRRLEERKPQTLKQAEERERERERLRRTPRLAGSRERKIMRQKIHKLSNWSF